MTNSTNSSLFPLESFAVNPKKLPPVITAGRAPTANDKELPGTRWVDDTVPPFVIYQTSGGGAWEVMATTSSAFTTLQGNDADPISPDAGLGKIIGAGGVEVTKSDANTLIINANPSSFSWTNGNSGGALINGVGYFVTAGTPSFSLPATAAIGDEFAIMLSGGTSWTITQGALQSVIVGVNTSSVGAGGSVASTAAGDTIYLVCFGVDTEYQAFMYTGALNVL